jgi:hypothetical protein
MPKSLGEGRCGVADFPCFFNDPDAITLFRLFGTQGVNVWKSGPCALTLVSICGFSASKGSLQKGIFLTLSSVCYILYVCIRPTSLPHFHQFSFTFKHLTTLRTMLVSSVGVRLGQIKVVSHFRTTKNFQFFKIFNEQSTGAKNV